MSQSWDMGDGVIVEVGLGLQVNGNIILGSEAEEFVNSCLRHLLVPIEPLHRFLVFRTFSTVILLLPPSQGHVLYSYPWLFRQNPAHRYINK